MIYIKHDTTKIKECGKDIIDLANQYENLITSMFERLNNLDDAWRGEDARRFISELKQEENIYISFGESLKKYGQTLTEVSTEITNTLNNTDINK